MGQPRSPSLKKDSPQVTLVTLNTRTGPPRPKPASSLSRVATRSRPKRRLGIRQWICYHNPAEMGCSAEEANPHSVETGKSRLNPRNMIGDRIWLIGRQHGTDKYYLHGFFMVDSFEDRRNRPGQKGKRNLIISGSRARQFRRKVRVDRESWFRMYKSEMRQLSLGLQSVREPRILDGLRNAVLKHPLVDV